VLFDCQLMEFGRELKDNVPRTPTNGFVKTVYARLLANGSDPGIQLDTLRKLWGRALDEYSIADTRLCDRITHGLAMRYSHVTELCAFCAGSQEHLQKIEADRAEARTGAREAAISEAQGATALGTAPLAAAGAQGGAALLGAAPVSAALLGAAPVSVALLGAAPLAAAGAQGGAGLPGVTALGAAPQAADTAQPEQAMPHAFAPREGADARKLMHSVYGDAHFGFNHLAAAGSATTHGPALVGLTLPDAFVHDFAPPTTSSTIGPGAAPQACADRTFSADKVVATQSKRNDVTGVAALFCRHSFLLILLNMPTGAILLFTCHLRLPPSYSPQHAHLCGSGLSAGERWAYVTLLLRTLLQAGLLPIFFYYDINCRWSAHFRAWAAGAGAEGALAMDCPRAHGAVGGAVRAQEAAGEGARRGGECGMAGELRQQHGGAAAGRGDDARQAGAASCCR